MHFLFLDESGDLGALKSDTLKNSQPVFVLGGLIVSHEHIYPLTTSLLALKQKHFRKKEAGQPSLSTLLDELKGSQIRRDIRKRGFKARAQLQFMDDLLETLEKYNCRILASIYVKGIDKSFNGRAVYTTAIQKQARLFQNFLRETNSDGIIVADSRYHHQNSFVTHSVFTQQVSIYRGKNRILESPLFGNSRNHAGIQIADLVVSTLIVPISLATYCQDIPEPTIQFNYDHMVKLRYAKRMKKMQLTLANQSNQRFGFFVNDAIANKTSEQLFIHSSY